MSKPGKICPCAPDINDQTGHSKGALSWKQAKTSSQIFFPECLLRFMSTHRGMNFEKKKKKRPVWSSAASAFIV